MRKSLLFLLLASAAFPAFAADESDDRAARREAARAERAERAEARAERAEPRGERERPAAVEATRERVIETRRAPDVQVEPARERVTERRGPRFVDVDAVRPTPESRREVVEPRVHRGPRVVEVDDSHEVVEPRERRGPRIVEVDGTDSVRDWRRAERGGGATPALVQQRTDTGWEPLRRHRDQTVDAVRDRIAPIISRTPREGTQPPLRTAADRSGTTAHRWRGDWRRDWRSDRRHDWRDHRRRHRSLFHFGFYYDPFGWNYRPYSIGWRLWPSYYQSSYWLQDPGMYRLPYAPPGYRWIRYYDDALLVDTWDGTVVDVIRDFFW